MLWHIYLVRNKKTSFFFDEWDLLQGVSACFLTVFCVTSFPQQSSVMYPGTFCSGGICSKSMSWLSGGGKEKQTRHVRAVEATSFWSSYSTMIPSGHLCTLPVAKPLSGTLSSLQPPLPSSLSWFLSLPTRAKYTLSYSLPHSPLLYRARSPSIISESAISFCEGFNPYRAVSIRHLVTCLAQTGAERILNEKDGNNWVCLCLSHRRHNFYFFIAFAHFRKRACKTPLKRRTVSR